MSSNQFVQLKLKLLYFVRIIRNSTVCSWQDFYCYVFIYVQHLTTVPYSGDVLYLYTDILYQKAGHAVVGYDYKFVK